MKEKEDADLFVKGALELNKMIRYGPAKSIATGYNIEENISYQKMKEYVMMYSDTIYHPVGTCKMGKDDMSVVDS